METTYHTDVFLPEIARRVSFAAMVHPTPHARHASQNDRYGAFTIPTVFDTRKATLIEATLANGVVVKVVYRQSHDEGHDIVLVIDPRKSIPVVITAWLNEKDDAHRTLDTSRYGKN